MARTLLAAALDIVEVLRADHTGGNIRDERAALANQVAGLERKNKELEQVNEDGQAVMRYMVEESREDAAARATKEASAREMAEALQVRMSEEIMEVDAGHARQLEAVRAEEEVRAVAAREATRALRARADSNDAAAAAEAAAAYLSEKELKAQFEVERAALVEKCKAAKETYEGAFRAAAGVQQAANVANNLDALKLAAVCGELMVKRTEVEKLRRQEDKQRRQEDKQHEEEFGAASGLMAHKIASNAGMAGGSRVSLSPPPGAAFRLQELSEGDENAEPPWVGKPAEPSAGAHIYLGRQGAIRGNDLFRTSSQPTPELQPIGNLGNLGNPRPAGNVLRLTDFLTAQCKAFVKQVAETGVIPGTSSSSEVIGTKEFVLKWMNGNVTKTKVDAEVSFINLARDTLKIIKLARAVGLEVRYNSNTTVPTLFGKGHESIKTWVTATLNTKEEPLKTRIETVFGTAIGDLSVKVPHNSTVKAMKFIIEAARVDESGNFIEFVFAVGD